MKIIYKDKNRITIKTFDRIGLFINLFFFISGVGLLVFLIYYAPKLIGMGLFEYLSIVNPNASPVMPIIFIILMSLAGPLIFLFILIITIRGRNKTIFFDIDKNSNTLKVSEPDGTGSTRLIKEYNLNDFKELRIINNYTGGALSRSQSVHQSLTLIPKNSDDTFSGAEAMYGTDSRYSSVKKKDALEFASLMNIPFNEGVLFNHPSVGTTSKRSIFIFKYVGWSIFGLILWVLFAFIFQ